MSTEVARVVEDDRLSGGLGREPSLLDELAEQLGVVHHVVVAPELRILVAERVEAMGALGDDRVDAQIVQRLDVLERKTLEDVLVTGPSRRITRAQFLRPENAEVDTGLVEQARCGERDIAVAVVVGARTPDPHEVLGLHAGLTESLDLEVERIGPIPPGLLVHAVDIR